MNLNIIRKNPLSLPVLIADKMGIFEKYNIKVNLDIVDDFTFDGNSPFYEGKSDAMIGDTTFFFYMLKRGKKAVITSDLTRTISLVARNGINKDSKLKAGVNRAGLFRLFLENDLKSLSDRVEIVWINNTYERMQAFKNKEIDLLVAIEPFVTDVIKLGGEVIWSLKDSKSNFVMWAFDEEFYKNNKEEVKAFYKAIQEAQDIFNSLNSQEKVKMAINLGGYNEEAANRLQNFHFEELKKYRVDDFNICQEWMYREKEINELYDTNKYIVDVFS